VEPVEVRVEVEVSACMPERVVPDLLTKLLTFPLTWAFVACFGDASPASRRMADTVPAGGLPKPLPFLLTWEFAAISPAGSLASCRMARGWHQGCELTCELCTCQ